MSWTVRTAVSMSVDIRRIFASLIESLLVQYGSKEQFNKYAPLPSVLLDLLDPLQEQFLRSCGVLRLVPYCRRS